MIKILIVRLGAMGDILHALPAVTGIRAALPEATIGWMVEEKWSELLACAGTAISGDVDCRRPLVNQIHYVNTRQWRSRIFHSPALIAGVRRAVRAGKYDVALDFQGAIKSAMLARISGAAVKAGFVTPRESAARFLYSERYGRIGEHVIEQNLGLAAQALKKYIGPLEIKLMTPPLPQDPAAESWANAEIQRLGIASFALMNPGAGWDAKQWPAQRYGEVALALARHGLKTLVNAAPGEEPLAQQVIDASGGNALMVHSTIGQLIALTRRARLFVGGDTGPLHLAAALGIPTVGLFGPTDPARTGPFGKKCVALRHPESQTTFSHHQQTEAGLLKITVDEAVGAARWLLGGGHG
ncbi:MAG TPA: glycosyltransferase family 9 protein [Candidatus Saccharimonadales bacterium]|jgi:heptosyltransferase-1|nr:glycosyltransferase family 9 protein [Candidatus Saccharimonadales bacterium]